MKSTILLILTVIITTFSLGLSAQTPTETAVTGNTLSNRMFRLQLEMPIVGFYYDKITTGDSDFDNNGTTTVPYFQAGVGSGKPFAGYMIDTELPSIPQLGFSLGGKLGNNIVIGAKLTAGFAYGNYKSEYYDSYDGSTYKSENPFPLFSVGLLPYLEVMSGGPGKVKPFLKVIAGFQMEYSKIKGETADDGSWSVSVPRGVFGGGGGIHVFILPQCSLDLSLEALFSIGKIIYKEEDEGDTYEGKSDIKRFSAETSLGLSVWL